MMPKTQINVKSPCATCTKAVEGIIINDSYAMVKCTVYDLFIPVARECKDHEPYKTLPLLRKAMVDAGVIK